MVEKSAESADVGVCRTGHLAIFNLPIPSGDFCSPRLEVLDRDTSLGRFPVAHFLEDPFDVGP
ncbi:MAG: hypothetical protein ABIP45_01465 [Knoellia sp.]